MGILAFLGLKKYDDTVYSLYGQIVAQARLEGFYILQGVPDTVNGRFELITLHIFIVMHRLKELGEEGGKLSQELFDVMFGDMDKNMREMGVGDLGVGRKIKALAKSFYGRIKAYDDAIAGTDGATMTEALKRNLYLDCEPTEAQVVAVADYIGREIQSSKNWSFEGLKSGEIEFGSIPTNGSE